MSLILTSHASDRHAVRVEIASPLVRAFAFSGDRQGWFGRFRFKFVKALFFAIHQRLGIRAAGRLMLPGGRGLEIDCADTAFLEHARVAHTGRCYEPETTALLELLAPWLGTVYYVGTNWGYYAVLLASNPEFRGRIHAFEVNPASFRALERVMAEAGFDDVVTAHCFGLSDRAGSVRLSREKHSVLTKILPGAASADEQSARVERLDDLVLPTPDLIKLDVEGHETAVLEGGLGLLRRSAPFIIIESAYRPDDEVAMLRPLQLIEAEDYVFYRLAVCGGRLEASPIRSQDRRALAETIDLFGVPARRRDLLSTVMAGR
jgi:FkbM family methyltransferase